MIAEIKHKNVDIGSEDQLSGNVFGALRYLPYAVFRQIIVNSIKPSLVSTILEQSLPSDFCDGWGRNLHFWRHFSGSQTEPDIVIDLGQTVILIEVKYNSDLSSDNQLIREAELLLANFSSKKKFLILLAREESAIAIFNEQKSNIPAEVLFSYITWQKLLDSIRRNKTDSLVLDDLSALLNEKGFGGFREFEMMNEETIKAFQTVREAHKNVQEFISRCIALAEEKDEFELAPMTGNNTFLRRISDRDSDAWSYCSFIVVFQRRLDVKLKNGYRNGVLYVLELNFDFEIFEIPMANVARYDYDNTKKNWSPISPSNHWRLYEPMYNGYIEFPEYEDMYCGEAAEPLERYWGLKRILGYEVPLSDITADNAYEKIFSVFNELAKR